MRPNRSIDLIEHVFEKGLNEFKLLRRLKKGYNRAGVRDLRFLQKDTRCLGKIGGLFSDPH